MQREAELVMLRPRGLPPQSPLEELDGLESERIPLRGCRGRLSSQEKAWRTPEGLVAPKSWERKKSRSPREDRGGRKLKADLPREGEGLLTMGKMPDSPRADQPQSLEGAMGELLVDELLRKN